MIVVIDHFDSFTYNIVQAYQKLGRPVEVIRCHAFSLESIEKMAPKLIVLGPGPGSPSDYPHTKELLTLAAKGISIFGICLGHQLIGETFGASVTRAQKAMHGKTTPILHNNQGLFSALPQNFPATRYNSLLLENLPNKLQITAWTPQGEVMAISHHSLPIQGVQFHPESIATEFGLHLLQNSLQQTS